MHKSLENASNALYSLGTTVLNTTNDDRSLIEMHGWNQPALTRHDLADFATNLFDKINELDLEEINDDSLENKINEIPGRLQLLIDHGTIQNIFNGHGAQAVPVYINTLYWVSDLISPLFSWQVLQDNKALPPQLTKRLRSIQAELSEIMPDKKAIEDKIKLIQDATDAAESLPADMETLQLAQKNIQKLQVSATELFGKIDGNLIASNAISNKLKEKKDEADKIVENCEEAYRITTTKGLAAAFDQRAGRLANSMWAWVVGLLIALAMGGIIGAQRFEKFTSAIETQNQTIGILIMDFVISVISIGAPIWFAWLSTKQISQRFRLSEDYAFKASVAKAYEGYRREAARIDKAFEARLFSSALTRLEEAPLRLMEQDTHGSPWQELLNSPQLMKAIETIPGFREKITDLAKDGIELLKNGKQTVESNQNLDNNV